MCEYKKLSNCDREFLKLCIEIAEEDFKNEKKFGTAGSPILLRQAAIVKIKLGIQNWMKVHEKTS